MSFAQGYKDVLKVAGIDSVDDFVSAIEGDRQPASRSDAVNRAFEQPDNGETGEGRNVSWSDPANPESPATGAVNNMENMNTGMSSGKAASLHKSAFLGSAAKGVAKGIGKGFDMMGDAFKGVRNYSKGAREAVEEGNASWGQKTWDDWTRSDDPMDVGLTAGFGAYGANEAFSDLE